MYIKKTAWLDSGFRLSAAVGAEPDAVLQVTTALGMRQL